ncbi:MAG TPA: hypothetical protein VF691_12110 [Cytophagaceae bacterium]|jgi:hypothetical protein
MDRSEKSYKNHGIILSLLIHALLLALFFFFILKTPNPPLTEGGSGIELNYGTVDEGSGDIQTMNEANPSPVEEEVAPSEQLAASEEIPSPQPEPQPASEEVPEKLITSEDESSIKLKEETPKPKKEIVKEVVKEKEKEKEKAPPGIKTEEVSKNTSNGKTGTEEKIGGNNNGDKKDKVGDQGNPQGSLDAQALYGNPGTGGPGPGGSGGGLLQMSGWKLVSNLKVDDKSSENGKIVFEIKVDEEGELLSVRAVEKTVSQSLVKIYENKVWKDFAVIREGKNTAPVSTGRIIYNIRSR